jgi:hypothetical protein
MRCAAEGCGEGLGFELAEVALAVGGEDGRDGEAGAGLDEGVEVEEVPAEAGGEQAAYGGLAGAHEAGEDEAAEMGGRSGFGEAGTGSVWLQVWVRLGSAVWTIIIGSFEYKDNGEKQIPFGNDNQKDGQNKSRDLCGVAAAVEVADALKVVFIVFRVARTAD